MSVINKETMLLKNYINGEWVDAKGKDILDVPNPATGELLAKVPISSKEDVELAVSAANEAFKAWIVESEIATNIDEYEQAWKFKLSDNFNLGKKGLILQYGEYEIGPYVVGLPRLVIPYDQLNGIIQAKYLPESAKVSNAASDVAAKEMK